MDQPDFSIPNGAIVYDRDGDTFGSVREVYQAFILVERGWFSPTDYYVPYSAIRNVEGDRITLNVSKDEALNQGWETFPDTTPPIADSLAPDRGPDPGPTTGRNDAPVDVVNGSASSAADAEAPTGQETTDADGRDAASRSE